MASPVWWDGINFKAWIAGVLSTITLPSNGSASKPTVPYFPEVEDTQFESLYFPRPIPSIINEITFTTTGNIDDLDFSNSPIIRMNNASDSTIRGLKAGYSGQRVTIVSVGAGNVFLAHQNTNSSAANRLINFVTGGNTPLAAGVGTSTFQYDDTTDRWRLIEHEQGAFLAVTYNSGNFVGGGSQTWTVESADVRVNRYLIKGRILHWFLGIDNSSVSGTPDTRLIATIPGGYTTVSNIQGLISQALDNNVSQSGANQISTTVVTFRLLSALNWTASTNATSVYTSQAFEIQ